MTTEKALDGKTHAGIRTITAICAVALTSVAWAGSVTNYQNVVTAELGVSESWVDENGENPETSNREGADYVVDQSFVSGNVYLNMPSSGANYVFNGDSLTLGNGVYLSWTKEMNSSIGPKFTCKKLRCKYNSSIYFGLKCPGIIDGGIVEILGTVNWSAHGARQVTINSELTGSGGLKILGKVGSASNPYSYHQLTALNTNFFGTIHLVQHDTTHNSFAQAITLTITDGRNLGGNLSSMTPKALLLSRYGKLIVNGTTALPAESNRGILIGDSSGRIGRIAVTAGKMFRVETQIGLDGTLYKESDGILELAGAMKFGSNGTASTPAAGLNGLVVSGGVVRVCSADAINGADVLFGSTGAMELAVDPSDATLSRYGIRNVKTDMPFSLPEGVTELPLTLHTNGMSVASAFSVGVLTVSPNAAGTVRAMLPAFSNPFRGYRMEPTETTDAETGEVTFGLAFVKRGTTICVR